MAKSKGGPSDGDDEAAGRAKDARKVALGDTPESRSVAPHWRTKGEIVQEIIGRGTGDGKVSRGKGDHRSSGRKTGDGADSILKRFRHPEVTKGLPPEIGNAASGGAGQEPGKYEDEE